MFNQQIADSVCDLLMDGHSLRKSCLEVGIAPMTVLGWVKANPDYSVQYARAREIGYSLLADGILDISDEKDVEAKYDGDDVRLELSATSVARNRLRVDARKWMLSKVLPKIYGDKIQVQGDADNPLNIQFNVKFD